MRLSISRSRENIWIWLLWGIFMYLVLELGPFVLVAAILKRSAGELVGPYLAFAIPWMFLAPLIWWLRRWEEQGASHKRLAHGWALAVALFAILVAFAVCYSGVVLFLVKPTDAITNFLVAVLLIPPVLYFVMYLNALRIISGRPVAMQGGGTGPK